MQAVLLWKSMFKHLKRNSLPGSQVEKLGESEENQ